MLLYFRLWEGERSCQKAASYLSLSVDTEWTAQNSQDGTEWVHFCRHAWASQVPGAKSSSTRQWEPTQALGHLPFALHSTDWWPCLLCSTLTNSNVLLDQVWHSLKSICFSIRSGLGSFRRQRPPNQGIPHCTPPPHTHFPYHQNSQPPLPQMTKPTSLDSKFHDTTICSDSGPNRWIPSVGEGPDHSKVRGVPTSSHPGHAPLYPCECWR